MKKLERLSFGVGDRFAHQGVAQLRAFQKLREQGVDVTPVWNKSHREHTFVGSNPESVLTAAREAVATVAWDRSWHVDADHINLKTVDGYLPHADFFTIDVADWISKPAPDAELTAALERHPEFTSKVTIPGLEEPIELSRDQLERIVRKYLLAVKEAGRIYHHLVKHKGAENLIAEVSMDETDTPQTPAELLVILALLADEGVQLQTIAPKFTGRFNKGVDYVGDLEQFQREFHADLSVIQYTVEHYGLPSNLKLSVHSGSDKFSLYPIIREALAKTGAGVHVKTAGTTWLEEVIGLCEAGGEGLAMAKEIAIAAIDHVEELCAPYASVIDIDRSRLPSAEELNSWDGTRFANAIRHLPDHPEFNPHLRQLLHVSFKLAAKQGDRYRRLLKQNADIVGRNVTENIYQRHLLPLFVN